MKILKMKSERGDAIKAMRAITERAGSRDLTTAETAAFDAHVSSVDKLSAAIEREEKLMAFETSNMASARVIHDPNGQHHSSYSDQHTESCRLAPFAKSRAFAKPEAAYAAGKWIQASLLGDSGARRWCVDRGIGNLQNALSESDNSKGGYLVPDQMATEIIRLVEQYGVARQECRVLPMSGDTLSIPRRVGGLTTYFVGENSAGTESDATWNNVTLTARKLMTLTRVSSELNDDALIDVAETLTQEIALAFASTEDNCLFNGTGTSTYGGIQGILSKIIDGTHTAGAVDVATATHNLFSELDSTDLSTMKAKCPGYALRNAKWVTSRTGWALTFERLLQSAGGNTMVTLSDGAPVLRYLGHEVVISEWMPNGVATDYNNLPMILFGDMRMAATLGARRDMRVGLSDQRWFELDQLGVKGTERFDINVHDLGDNTNAGPIVALVGSSS